MNRRDFLSALIKELKNMDSTELQDVLQYYNEYFDDAGAENEQQVIAELGSPQKIATSIKAASTIKYCETGNTTPKKSAKAIWLTIGAICAAPIALPLAAVVLSIFIALIVALSSILIAFFAISVALVLCGIILIVTSFFLISLMPFTFLFLIGLGFILSGFAILAFMGTYYLSKACFKLVMLFINHSIIRRNKSDV